MVAGNENTTMSKGDFQRYTSPFFLPKPEFGGRAHEILKDMRKKREALISNNPSLQQRNDITIKNEVVISHFSQHKKEIINNIKETFRAKEILEVMKDRRVSFLSILELRKPLPPISTTSSNNENVNKAEVTRTPRATNDTTMTLAPSRLAVNDNEKNKTRKMKSSASIISNPHHMATCVKLVGLPLTPNDAQKKMDLNPSFRKTACTFAKGVNSLLVDRAIALDYGIRLRNCILDENKKATATTITRKSLKKN
eukprot:CAMPEP_0194192656 /NCGR_PEP_ID=MMETSP0154-20130528/71524_1 /TAXON_ID=1049557 /ORGANISM="Thalassiothrix antarctica, Strain L6-D1" /LENGTH=253 /DNA_ID=CAMNT_0038916273 /DNA_START=35 /DNA_END=796 /DNA_ORIENTATION=-